MKERESKMVTKQFQPFSTFKFYINLELYQNRSPSTRNKNDKKILYAGYEYQSTNDISLSGKTHQKYAIAQITRWRAKFTIRVAWIVFTDFVGATILNLCWRVTWKRRIIPTNNVNLLFNWFIACTQSLKIKIKGSTI